MTSVTSIALPVPFPIATVNVVLIEDERLTLVDTGPRHPAALAALELELERRGRRLEDIELVLLTHQHIDHVGLAATIRRRAGATIAGLAPLAAYLERLDESLAADNRFSGNLMREFGVPADVVDENLALMRSLSQFAESVEVDLSLRDGDVVDVGRRRLRVLHRPGHSPTDTLFVDEASGEAVVGDHLLARISSNAVAHRPPNGSEDPPDRVPALVVYQESLARTRALDLTTLLPGHHETIDDHRTLIDERIRRHGERATEILRLVQDGCQRVPEIAQRLWGDVDRLETMLTVSEIVGHVDLLVRDGAVCIRRGRCGTILEAR